MLLRSRLSRKQLKLIRFDTEGSHSKPSALSCTYAAPAIPCREMSKNQVDRFSCDLHKEESTFIAYAEHVTCFE